FGYRQPVGPGTEPRVEQPLRQLVADFVQHPVTGPRRERSTRVAGGEENSRGERVVHSGRLDNGAAWLCHPAAGTDDDVALRCDQDALPVVATRPEPRPGWRQPPVRAVRLDVAAISRRARVVHPTFGQDAPSV